MEGSWEYIAMDKKRNRKDNNNIMTKSLVESKQENTTDKSNMSSIMVNSMFQLGADEDDCSEDKANSNHHCSERNVFKTGPFKKFPFSLKEGILWQQKNKAFSRYF